MKNVLIVSALLLSVSTASAQSLRFVSSDGSDLSALCIAAVTTDSPLPKLASNYGVARYEIHDVRCNGIPLTSFAARYKSNGKAVQKADDVLRKNTAQQ
ncbi:MAG TPA: hypothetical protein VMH83_13275 [Candidatus Acidoferrum sp.]|nr:hypothetical protein [Candidatus Acidoferrum sp.]